MSSFGVRISAGRVAGGELSVRQRDSIISKHEAGISSLKLAEEFGCSKRTINRTIQGFKATHTNLSLPESRQPPKLSRQEKCYLFHLAGQKLKIEYLQMQHELGTVKFSDVCIVQQGSGRNTEWNFGHPDEKYDCDKVTEVTTDHGKYQMVWAAVWVTRGGRVGRSPFAIMRRDERAPRRRYITRTNTVIFEEPPKSEQLTKYQKRPARAPSDRAN